MLAAVEILNSKVLDVSKSYKNLFVEISPHGKRFLWKEFLQLDLIFLVCFMTNVFLDTELRVNLAENHFDKFFAVQNQYLRKSQPKLTAVIKSSSDYS